MLLHRRQCQQVPSLSERGRETLTALFDDVRVRAHVCIFGAGVYVHDCTCTCMCMCV